MSETKTMIRFFTIADYEDEEIWLREQHRKGWKLQRMIVPCFYIFEACTPEDVIYRLDYRNNEEDSEYLQLFRDYGWEQFARCMGWLYFRKSASEIESEEDGEIFSDDASRVELVDHVVRTRMLPLLTIFLCCVLPNLFRSLDEGFATGMTVFFGVMFLLYLYLFIHCGFKLRHLRKKYSREE